MLMLRIGTVWVLTVLFDPSVRVLHGSALICGHVGLIQVPAMVLACVASATQRSTSIAVAATPCDRISQV